MSIPERWNAFCQVMVQLTAIRSAFLIHALGSFGLGIILDTRWNAIEDAWPRQVPRCWDGAANLNWRRFVLC